MKNVLFLFLATALIGTGCGDDGGTDASTDTSTGDTSPGDTSTGDTSPGDTSTGDTAVPGGDFCEEECTADGDCTIGTADVGFTCVAGRCAGSSGCEEDAACIPTFSGWVTACTSGGGECDATAQVCTSLGLCATPAGGAVACDVLMQADYDTTDIDGGDITVCANLNYECIGGTCVDPCEADADCAALPSAPICNTGTGLCECGDDTHCAAVPGASVCVDGGCQCAADADCDDAPNGDVCMDGACGCSDVSACTTMTFDGTSFVCGG